MPDNPEGLLALDQAAEEPNGNTIKAEEAGIIY